jgi:hypothetical protein
MPSRLSLRDGRQAGEDAASERQESLWSRRVVLPADIDAMAAFYTTVLQGMSIRARDGASGAELAIIIAGAMAAWGPLTAGLDEVGHRATDSPTHAE